MGDLTGQQRSAGQGQLQHQEEPELPRGARKSLLLCTISEVNGMSSTVCVHMVPDEPKHCGHPSQTCRQRLLGSKHLPVSLFSGKNYLNNC